MDRSRPAYARIIMLAAATLAVAACGTPPQAGRTLGTAGATITAYAQSAAVEIARQTGAKVSDVATIISSTTTEVEEIAKLRAQLSPQFGAATDLILPASAPASANDVQVLIDPEQFVPAIETAIRAATRRVQLDVFLLGGEIGSRIANAFEDRRKAGVDVRVILDGHFAAMGPAHEQAVMTSNFLREHAIPTRTFPLESLLMPTGFIGRASMIDHQKIVVADDTAFIGCANLIDVAGTNHDLYFKVRGPIASEVSWWLDKTWERSPAPAAWKTKALPTFMPSGANTQARLTRTDKTEHSTYDRLLARIEGSQKIDFGIFEFDDPQVEAAIIRAKQRGAAIRMLFDRHQLDHKYTGKKTPAGIPNLLTIRNLLGAGISIRLYDSQRKEEEMHLKMALFNQNAAIVGSTNFTTKAFLNFRETGLELEGGQVVSDLQAMFEKDWATHSTEIKTLTAQQRAVAAAIAFLDKIGIGWW